MSHSPSLEEHANAKLKKIEDLLHSEEAFAPHYIELWLKANKQHPHHGVELHLKTPLFDLNAHEEGTDMYVVIDDTIDKMVRLLKKNKDRFHDKKVKVETPKKEFQRDNDSYELPLPPEEK